MRDEQQWKDIGTVLDTLDFWGYRVGRIGGQIKEKYGSIRWYADIRGANSLHDIVKAGHAGFRWGADDNFFMSLLNNFSKAYISPFSFLIFKYRCFMYGLAFYIAWHKCPNIKDEILSAADHDEFLFKKDRLYIEEQRAIWKKAREAKDEQTQV
jgi:hypothetical protein